MGWRQGSRLVRGEVELPRLLSLVQAVPVEVRLRVEVVVRSHLLVETEVLHSHRLKHFCQLCRKGPNNAPLWLPMYNFNLEPKKWEKKQLSRLTPVRGEQPGARRDYWP